MVYHVQFPGLGLDLTVNRVALAIGGFNIYWYGVIIAAGMLLAMLYAFRNAVDYGIDSDRPCPASFSDFRLPPRSTDNRIARNYLTATRRIDEEDRKSVV